MRYFDDELKREEFRAILESWLGTPYRHFNALKKAGVDCTLFVGKVLEEASILRKLEYQYYGSDWFLHTQDELMLKYINYHIEQLADGLYVEILPGNTELFYGDIICLKQDLALAANHTVFYIGQGTIMHAYHKAGVVVSKLADLKKSSIVQIYRIHRR